MNTTYSQLVLYFFLYSFVGWAFESTLCSFMERRPVNRGFLHGPICPVYGLGGVAILLLALPFREQPYLVFFLSLAAVTLLEYFVGWLLEKMFGMRWWDYAHCKFNLNGLICLKNSLFFGLMGLGMVYGLHPPLARLVEQTPGTYLRVISSSLMVVLILDLLTTLNNLLDISQRLQTLRVCINEMVALDKERSWYDKQDISGSLERLRQLIVEEPDPRDEDMLVLVERMEQLSAKWHTGRSGRLMRAYPNLKVKGLDEAVMRLRESFPRREKTHRRVSGFLSGIKEKTALRAKAAKEAVAEEVSLYRLGWIFLIAGVIGYILETLFCLVTTGSIESRQGLLYGPFNQVYGFGGVLMILLLSPLAKKSDRWLFFGGALVGGAFEWVCNWAQEQVFGTVSWDYTDHVISIGGRTSLLYMFFWGILGVWLIKGIYPWLCRIIARIPRRQGGVICGVLMVFLALNMVLSGLAVARWNERERGVPAETSVASWLDEQYPDEFMQEVYPNMIHRS